MKLSIGIDIGGSTTKAAGFTEQKELVGTLQVKADNPRTCTYGVLGRFLDENRCSLKDISKIILTGAGSTYFHEDIYGIPTVRMDELTAIGLGGLAVSGRSEALVVSMGTGTAFVRADRQGCRHLGGSGIGGGTLSGLASRFLHKTDIFALSEMAAHGDCSMADLRIGDLLNEDVPSLNSDLTASNFGKIKSGATDSDMAAALFNMIYEGAGVMAVMALTNDTLKDAVLTGSLASLPQAGTTFEVFNRMHDVFGVNFIIPPHAAFATAIGAVLGARES